MTGWSEQFLENESRLSKHSECADFWVMRARLLMLEDGPSEMQTPYGVDEVEKCILKALDLDPDHLEALEEAAHFYDCIVLDRDKAVMHAKRYNHLAGKVVEDMKAIIEDAN